MSMDIDAMERAVGGTAKGSCGLPATWYCVPHELLVVEPTLIVGRMLAGVPSPNEHDSLPAPAGDAAISVHLPIYVARKFKSLGITQINENMALEKNWCYM